MDAHLVGHVLDAGRVFVFIMFSMCKNNSRKENFTLIWGHSRLGYYFWDKGLKDYVVVDLGVYHDLLLFDQ